MIFLVALCIIAVAAARVVFPKEIAEEIHEEMEELHEGVEELRHHGEKTEEHGEKEDA